MKAKVTKPDGTVLELEGTAEEISRVVDRQSLAPTQWLNPGTTFWCQDGSLHDWSPGCYPLTCRKCSYKAPYTQISVPSVFGPADTCCHEPDNSTFPRCTKCGQHVGTFFVTSTQTSFPP
jgi:hypothetical protein